MPGQPILINFSGGINNRYTPLQLFIRQQGEVQSLVNADTTLMGRLKLLRPLAALNATAEGSSIHSIIRANGVVLVGSGINLKYQDSAALTSIFAALSGEDISFAHAGNWVFLADGTNEQAVYLTGQSGCDWGLNPPTAAPTVTVGAAGTTKDNTFSCYYRYKITLPDGTIIRTELSSAGTVVITGADANKKIEWTALVHATFTGATTVAIELFRTGVGWAATYLVAEVASGTTTYSDDVSDALLQLETEFAETGYYGPPSGVNITVYHEGADRVFCTVDNEVYWSEAGLYHTFVYDETADEYTNVNSVFLEGEDVTGMVMFDEQLYIGCQRTWKRLRGTNPYYWSWEPISGAIKGPLSWGAMAVTPWGIIYPGNDGHIWIFNGFETARIVEHFVFATKPDATCHSTYDGRFYRLFYGDTTYPELILDFLEFPRRPPRVIQSTRDASASFYDPSSNTFYLGDEDGYLRNGEDTDTEVTLTMRTAEVPIEQIINLGAGATLLIHANSQDVTLQITPYYDDVAQDPITTVRTSSLERVPIALPWNDYRAVSFEITITTAEDIEIREPWLLRGEDDSAGRSS